MANWIIGAAAALAIASPATAGGEHASTAPGPAVGSVAGTVCKFVVSAKRGSKPTRLCLTESQWAAKAAKDAEDANRIECRYEEVPGTKFRSKKVCQPASEWAEQRRLHREQIEQVQMKVCVSGAGC